MVGSASRREAPELQFAGWTQLSDVRFAESDKSRAIWPIFEKELQDFSDSRMGAVGLRKFWLCNAWEGRAMELIEDITKTRLEAKSNNPTRIRFMGRSSGMHGVDLWTAEYESQVYRRENNHSKILVKLNDKTVDFQKHDGVEVLVLATAQDLNKIRYVNPSLGRPDAKYSLE